jgi:hypothetical protein
MNRYSYNIIEMREPNAMKEYQREVEHTKHDFFCFMMQQFPTMRYLNRDAMQSLFTRCIVIQLDGNDRNAAISQLKPYAALPYNVYFDIHMIGRCRINLIITYCNGM